MDLTKLDRAGLAALRGNLTTVGTAADALAEGGLEPEICLTPEATILRAPPILSHGPEDTGPVLIERLPPVTDFQIAPEQQAIAPAPPAELPPGLPVAAKSARACSGKARAGGAEEAAPRFKHGPFSVEERAEVERMVRAGFKNANIALKLGRRVQSVSLFVTALKTGGNGGKTAKGAKAPEGFVPPPASPAEGEEQDAGQPAPVGARGAAAGGTGPEAAEAKPAATDAPEAGGTSEPESRMLGGEPGGLQRHSLAEKAPVQAAGKVMSKPPVSAAKAPAELPTWPVRMVEHVAGLSRLTAGQRWSDRDDIDLLTLFVSGMKLPEIAIDLARDAGKIKARLELLTDHHKVPSRDGDRWASRYEAADILALLRKRAGVPAV